MKSLYDTHTLEIEIELQKDTERGKYLRKIKGKRLIDKVCREMVHGK